MKGRISSADYSKVQLIVEGLRKARSDCSEKVRKEAEERRKAIEKIEKEFAANKAKAFSNDLVFIMYLDYSCLS